MWWTESSWIMEMVQDGDKGYLFGSRKYRTGLDGGLHLHDQTREQNTTNDQGRWWCCTATDMKGTYKWKCVEDLYLSTSPNEVETRLHQLLFENPMSIWLTNGAGGVQFDKKNKLLMFLLSIIHGSSNGLSFTAQHPRKLPPATTGEEPPPATAGKEPPPAIADKDLSDEEHQPIRCTADKEPHPKRVKITRTQPSTLRTPCLAHSK